MPLPSIRLRSPEPKMIGQFLTAGYPKMAFALSTLWLIRPVLVIGAMAGACILAPDTIWLFRLWR